MKYSQSRMIISNIRVGVGLMARVKIGYWVFGRGQGFFGI